MPVTAPADRRFLRAQVKPGRKQSPWRARLVAARTAVMVLVGLLVVWRGAWLVTHAETLKVAELEVSGNSLLTKEEVKALLPGLYGANIVTLRLEDWRTKLVASPWVADATLRRSLPSTIEVTIVERRPIAIGRKGEDLFLVDERGTTIDRYAPRYAELDLPILDGLNELGSQASDEDQRRAALAHRCLQAVRRQPELAKRISQVDVSDPRDAVVIVDKDTVRVRLGDTKFLERLQMYFDLASRLREQVGDIDYVDLRFGERVYVGSPQAKAGTGAMPPGGMPQPPAVQQ